jgi:hypothetical protein
VSSGGRKVYRLSLRGNRRLNHAIHMAAITQIRHKHSDGRAYYDRKIAEGKPTKKPCGRSSGGSAMPSTPACAPTPTRPPRQPRRTREGNRGTTLTPARPAPTPSTGSSDKPLPGLTPAYVLRQRSRRPCRRRRKPGEPLDNDDNKEDSICAAGKAGGLARDIAQVWGLWASGTTAAMGSSRTRTASGTDCGRARKPGWGRNQKASSTYRTRTCLLVQARSQRDFAMSARRSGLDAARRHLVTATFS